MPARRITLPGLFCVLSLSIVHAASNADEAGDTAPVLYAKHCAVCHELPSTKSTITPFEHLTPQHVLDAFETGVMGIPSALLSDTEKIAVAEFVTKKSWKPEHKASAPVSPHCDAGEDWFDFDDRPKMGNWGGNQNNSRFVSQQDGKLTAREIPGLELRWAVSFPRVKRLRSQASVAGGAVFLGTQTGRVYAFDQDSGCTHWEFQADAEVRNSIVFQPWDPTKRDPQQVSVFFGDIKGHVYSLNALTGKLLWKTSVDGHPASQITGSPVYYQDRLFVPVSSVEDFMVISPLVECCSHRGSVAALDAASGYLLWHYYPIDEPLRVVGKTSVGTRIFGPSGASVWGTPAIDEKLNRIYFGTSNDHSSPATGASDSIFALDLDSGKPVWQYQATTGDAWNVACITESPANCPAEDGPDVDFGAQPIIIEHGKQRLIIAGQKSGVVHGLDANNNGKLLWKTRIGMGGPDGGVHFGMAAVGTTVYVPVSDIDYADGKRDGFPPRPGLSALNALTGEVIWSYLTPDMCRGRDLCEPGISAAPTAVPGAVIAGAGDGIVRAYDEKTGEVIWSYDTTREIKTLSGETTRGGAIAGGAGPVVANGRLFLSSGYGFGAWMKGNAFLVFGYDD